jgi:hypothetical protein
MDSPTKEQTPTAPTTICFPCEKFMDGSLDERSWEQYHELFDSADRCGFCALVKAGWNVFPDDVFAGPSSNRRIRAMYRKHIYGPSESLYISAGTKEVEVHVGPGNISKESTLSMAGLTRKYLGEPKPFPKIGSRTSLHENSRSDDFFRWLREQDQACLRTHAACHPNTSSLPKRLVDVGSISSDTVRIIETAHTSSFYTTLSHCWGFDADPKARTLKDNIRARYTGIDVELLPKTFQDAISVTRQIGIQYIWIDTLCIIQDNTCVLKSL